MSRFLRNAAAAVLAFAAVGATASVAGAQTYNRLVVFGDSLSDNGNLYAASFGTQPLSPPYFQGRFSNGPVFTELLGFNAGRYTAGAPVTGSVNYAFGGARSGLDASPPGLRRQLQLYTAAGGVFGPNDLVSVLGGANNLLQRFERCRPPISDPLCAANPTGFVAEPAILAAADINTLVKDIATAKAGTILVSNLPSLGLTPSARAGGATSVALADYAGTTFNSTLATGLFATAAAQPGSNIILVDLYKIGATLAANPAAFGLSNVTETCLVGATVCANPNSYLYFDSVHPTAAGHVLLAALANDYLYYGDLGAQATVQGETGYRQREDMLDAAADRLAGRAPPTEGSHMTFAVLADSVDTDARGVVGASETTGWGLQVGLEHGAGDWSFGLTGTLREGEVEAGPMGFDTQSYGFDAYAGWRSGDLFLNAVAGGSIDRYDDITRVTALTPIIHTGETDGGSIGFKLQGGMWFDMGGIALSPRAALNWVSADVNGYVEQGSAAQYAYADRTVDGFTGEVALRAEGGGDGMAFFVEGGYRDSLSDSADPVRVGIANNPAKVLQRGFDDPFGGAMMASAGASIGVGPGELSLSYRGRFGDSADSHLGVIGYRISLP